MIENILENPIIVEAEFPIHYEAMDYHEFSYMRDFLRFVFQRNDISFKETIFNLDTRKYEAVFYLNEQEEGADDLVNSIKARAGN